MMSMVMPHASLHMAVKSLGIGMLPENKTGVATDLQRDAIYIYRLMCVRQGFQSALHPVYVLQL